MASAGPAAPRDLSHAPLQVVSARTGVIRRLRNLVARRELLHNLITSDIRIKYKGSSLGFLWSMIAPALTLTTYYLVFSIFLKNGIPDFAIYLFSGLVVWNMFQNAVNAATSVIVDRAGLVKKVSFPREILALSNVGSAAIYFVSQLVVLFIFLALTHHAPAWSWLSILPFTFVALYLFTAAVAILASAITVYLRDVKHLMEVALQLWFWITPIVYSYENSIAAPLHRHGLATLYFLNPIALMVLTFQRVFYVHTSVVSTVTHQSLQLLPTWPYLTYLWVNIGLIGVMALFFVLAEAIFGRLEGDFESVL